MAYLQRQAEIDVPADAAWDALRDVGRLRSATGERLSHHCASAPA